MPASFLADKSALVRVSEPSVERRIAPLLLAGEIATCGVVDLEILYSARDHDDLRNVLRLRRSAYENIPTDAGDFDRALEVMERLSRIGQHRGVTIPDLL